MPSTDNRIDRIFATQLPKSGVQPELGENEAVRTGQRPMLPNRPGIWPFIPAGYPDMATTIALLQRLGSLDIRGIELGFPFSDPIADGPVIQQAFTEALAKGLRVDDIFAAVADARKTMDYPLLAMVSASIVYRIGVEAFIRRAAAAGFDGLIVPDLSLEEAAGVAGRVSDAGLRLAMLVAPTTPVERRERIAAAASGFLYYVSVQGVTGQRTDLAGDLEQQVRDLRTAAGLPVLVGFGISTAEHVRRTCSFADGAIVGSAIVQRMAELVRGGQRGDSLVEGTAGFISLLSGR